MVDRISGNAKKIRIHLNFLRRLHCNSLWEYTIYISKLSIVPTICFIAFS